MGCVVCTSAAAPRPPPSARSCPTNYAVSDNILRAPAHAEKVSTSVIRNHPRKPFDYLNADEDSESKGRETAKSAEAPQRHRIAVARRRQHPRAHVAPNSGHIAPTLSVDAAEGNTTVTSSLSYAARQSKPPPHGSPFPSSPTKQQQQEQCMGNGIPNPASTSTVPLRPFDSDGGRLSTSGAASNSRPQLPQYNQHRQSQHRIFSAASWSNKGHNLRESTLSDISETLSTMSGTAGSAFEMVSSCRGSLVGGRNSIKAGLFHNGDDLETQRQQTPLSIEEDLFIYDDIVISKDEARTKHWRVAGRKPTLLDSAAVENMLSGQRGLTNSVQGKKFFTFNDFDVCVDEMDWMPATTGAASSIAPLQQSPDTSTTLPDLKSMTVTNTVPRVPNTVHHFVTETRKTAPKANRPLRYFETTSLLGHATRVKCIALSPSETDFVSCSNEDASISLNNLHVNNEVGIFTGHQDTIINAAFSPDGKYLATTSKDKTMVLWDVITTKMLLTFAHPKVVICCCFDPSSKYLVSGCQDRVCRLWDTKRGKEWLRYTGHEGIIIAIAFSPDGNYVCSASADKSLQVWSATTAKTRFHLNRHTGIILSCSYTADGRHIVSNDESLLCVWATEDGSCKLSLSPADVAGATLRSARGPKLGWTLSSAAPGAFTGYMLVACNNRFVYVLDIGTGKEVTSVFCKAPVYSLATGSYEKMACGDSFGNIYILTLG